MVAIFPRLLISFNIRIHKQEGKLLDEIVFVFLRQEFDNIFSHTYTYEFESLSVVGTKNYNVLGIVAL